MNPHGQSGREVRGSFRKIVFVISGLVKVRGQSRNHRMGLIILILVVLLLVGAFPTRGYGFGYLSHGLIGTILIIVVILFLLGRL
jgi:hypothetical protein